MIFFSVNKNYIFIQKVFCFWKDIFGHVCFTYMLFHSGPLPPQSHVSQILIVYISIFILIEVKRKKNYNR